MIVNGKRANDTWKLGELSDSEDDNISTSEPAQDTSELEELLASVRAANVSFMKISMVIRSSPARDDYLKAATRYTIPSIYDINHVKEKHGSARKSQDWLLRRLGKAITRRRQYLKYREQHHGKLSRDWDTEVKDKVGSKPSYTVSSTKATTYVPNEPLLDDRAGSDTAGSFGSQTSYEATMVGENTETKLNVPPPPKEAFEGIPFEFGEPFQCPYCYTEQKVKNKAAWKYDP